MDILTFLNLTYLIVTDHSSLVELINMTVK